jgi:hypothetical protein
MLGWQFQPLPTGSKPETVAEGGGGALGSPDRAFQLKIRPKTWGPKRGSCVWGYYGQLAQGGSMYEHFDCV